ncbi:MAG: transcription antitermination factor NusB [Bacteroidia bacterium]|nr:transcription antitermination factor NusB [Bacteroidia bacterium]
MPLNFRSYLESDKDIEVGKYFPSKENIRAASVLDNNGILQSMEDNEQFNLRAKKIPYSWDKYGEVFEKLFPLIRSEDFFVDYLVFENPDLNQQKEFLLSLYEYAFANNEFFNDKMEEAYANWQDDDIALIKSVMRTIETISSDKPFKLSMLSNNEAEDIAFARELFEKAITEKETINELVTANAPNWDTERITIVDMILIEMAVCEFMFFKEVPVKVTINEYLDIAKEYSTPKSNMFLNGVLDKIRIKLTEQGKVSKTGRGLRDN